MTLTTAKPDAGRVRPSLRGLPWITWRQHRVALAGVITLLGGMSVFFLFNGLAMHHDYTALGLGSCGNINGPSCQPLLDLFSNKYSGWAQFLPRFLEFIPCLSGMFIGAPLVARELESGTFRFLWTQGRNRGRWIFTKLAIIGAALVVVSLGFPLSSRGGSARGDRSWVAWSAARPTKSPAWCLPPAPCSRSCSAQCSAP